MHKDIRHIYMLVVKHHWTVYASYPEVCDKHNIKYYVELESPAKMVDSMIYLYKNEV